jgi:hypothetical protein
MFWEEAIFHAYYYIFCKSMVCVLCLQSHDYTVYRKSQTTGNDIFSVTGVSDGTD